MVRVLRERGRRAWWKYSQHTTGNIFVPRMSQMLLSWDNPPRLLEPGPNLQQWRVTVRRSAQDATDPLVKLELLDESGAVLDIPIDDEVVSGNSPVVLEGTWNAARLPFNDGTGARALLTCVNPKGNTKVDVAAMQWVPALSDAVGKNLSANWRVKKTVASQPIAFIWNVS